MIKRWHMTIAWRDVRVGDVIDSTEKQVDDFFMTRGSRSMHVRFTDGTFEYVKKLDEVKIAR